MKHPVSGLVRLLLLLGVMGIGSRSWAQAPASPAITGATPTLDFKFTTVDVPGARLTALNGISEAGIIVGEYFEPNGGPSHGFKLEGKVITKIDAPNGTNTACARISPNGLLIVGSYLSGRTLRTGYLYKNNTFTDIPGPDGTIFISPSGVNDNGDIVGMYEDSSLHTYAFLLKGGKYTKLMPEGEAAHVGATGINNNGEIVLRRNEMDKASKSFLYDGSSYKTIDVPGCIGSEAMDINNDGDILFQCFQSKGIQGALLSKGVYSKFDDPNGDGYTTPGGINNSRQIVGSYGPGGQNHGFEAKF